MFECGLSVRKRNCKLTSERKWSIDIYPKQEMREEKTADFGPTLLTNQESQKSRWISMKISSLFSTNQETDKMKSSTLNQWRENEHVRRKK